MAKIDNKAPHFDVSVYLNPFKLLEDNIRTKEIVQENLSLMRKMNIIHQFGVSISLSVCVNLLLKSTRMSRCMMCTIV